MNKKIITLLIIIVLILLGIIVYNKFNNQKEIENNISDDYVLENNNENVVDSSENILGNNNTNIQENTINTKNATITSEVSPSGFMGSSLYKVILYSDGEVYVETFDGNGYEEQNIVSKELVAKKGTSIKRAEDDENYGMIIVKAEEIVNDNIGWIKFE